MWLEKDARIINLNHVLCISRWYQDETEVPDGAILASGIRLHYVNGEQEIIFWSKDKNLVEQTFFDISTSLAAGEGYMII